MNKQPKQFDKSQPHGEITGNCIEYPGARFEQNGAMYDSQGALLYTKNSNGQYEPINKVNDGYQRNQLSAGTYDAKADGTTVNPNALPADKVLTGSDNPHAKILNGENDGNYNDQAKAAEQANRETEANKTKESEDRLGRGEKNVDPNNKELNPKGGANDVETEQEQEEEAEDDQQEDSDPNNKPITDKQVPGSDLDTLSKQIAEKEAEVEKLEEKLDAEKAKPVNSIDYTNRVASAQQKLSHAKGQLTKLNNRAAALEHQAQQAEKAQKE